MPNSKHVKGSVDFGESTRGLKGELVLKLCIQSLPNPHLSFIVSAFFVKHLS